MTHKIHIARAWCDECLRDCFFAYDEATGQNQHVGPESQDLSEKAQELGRKGYKASHRSGVFTYTLYKAAPLALPLDWQFVNDRYEAMDAARQKELLEQDW
jgi:hypothetical protein